MTTAHGRNLLKFACLMLIFVSPALKGAQNEWRDAATFEIYVNDERIGQEKYSIQVSNDSVTSNSNLSFKTPGSKQNVRVQTQLAANGTFVPRQYQVQTDIGGRKGNSNIKGTFTPGEATFEYLVGGRPTKSGLLVGEQYSVLDTNVFHHFVFIARLFELDSDQPQSMEVVIPQELENGILRVTEVGVEEVSVDGRKRELRHLKADTGKVQIDLWIDDQKILYKIALPARHLEVVRNS